MCLVHQCDTYIFQLVSHPQVTEAFRSDLGVSSAEVGIVVVSEIDLGERRPFSASRLVATGQILPHPSLVLTGNAGPSMRKNKGYDPFPRELRKMEHEAERLRVYREFFPASPDAVAAWFIARIL